MMRLFKWFIPVCCVLALAACGGGGGGGPAPEPIPAPEPMAVSKVVGDLSKGGEVPEDFSGVNPGTFAAVDAGVDLGNGFTLEQGSLRILKDGQPFVTFETGTGGDVSYYGDAGEVMVARKVNDEATLEIIKALDLGEPGDSELKPGDYVNELLNERGDHFTGSVWWPSQTIYLNAGAVDLQYSSFGAWAYDVVYRGEVNGEPLMGGADFPSLEYRPFYGGDETRHAVPAVSAEFTGQAAAMAVRWADTVDDPDVFVPIRGEATLNVTGLSDVDLTLAFPEFYDITYSNFAINPVSGAIEVSPGNRPTLHDHGGNTTGVVLSDQVWPVNDNEVDGGTFLRGQFYGPDGLPASEAAGVFGLETTGGDGVVGSFGVVATP